MRLSKLVFAISCVIVIDPTSGSVAQDKNKSVPILVDWQGKVKIELKEKVPQQKYVADSETWKKLWTAFRGAEQVPSVNFKETIVLVAWSGDPNRIRVVPTIDGKGDLQMTYQSTLIAFENPTESAYQFAVISRDGIKSIRGAKIE